jgi:hypothetical protein
MKSDWDSALFISYEKLPIGFHSRPSVGMRNPRASENHDMETAKKLARQRRERQASILYRRFADRKYGL